MNRIQQGLALIESAVGDLQLIAQKLMGLSETGVGRGMAHTEGVDTLIDFVDRIEQESPLVEEQASSPPEPERPPPEFSRVSPSDPAAAGELPILCKEARLKAAELDCLNREGMTAALEVRGQAAEITRIERKLREWLASTLDTPAAGSDPSGGR